MRNIVVFAFVIVLTACGGGAAVPGGGANVDPTGHWVFDGDSNSHWDITATGGGLYNVKLYEDLGNVTMHVAGSNFTITDSQEDLGHTARQDSLITGKISGNTMTAHDKETTTDLESGEVTVDESDHVAVRSS